MATKIITKNGSGVPSDGALDTGELAVDLTNNKLYSSTDGTDVVEIGFSGESANGSATAPSLYFVADSATGMYSPFTGGFAVAANGTQRFTVGQAASYFTNVTVGGLGPASTDSYIKMATTGGLLGMQVNNISYACYFTQNEVYAGQILISGGTVAYQSASDYRLKENVVDISCGLSEVNQIRPVDYRMKGHTEDCHGFIAHELQAVCPHAVSGTKDAVDAEGNPMYQGVDMTKLIPMLVKAIQELTSRIEALEGA